MMNQHGGPNRNQGRKLGPWGKRRLLSIKCTPDEFEAIKALGTRERAEVLLAAIKKQTVPQGSDSPPQP